MKKLFFTLLVMLTFVVCSCMSDKEYQLRKADLEAKQNWQSTYVPVSIKGPVTIPEGGELVVTVPNMPYTQANIPDGQAIQASLVKDVVHTGALLGGAVYSIHKSNSGSGSHTTINNGGANQ